MEILKTFFLFLPFSCPLLTKSETASLDVAITSETPLFLSVCLSLCVRHARLTSCVCVRVRVRVCERERERAAPQNGIELSHWLTRIITFAPLHLNKATRPTTKAPLPEPPFSITEQQARNSLLAPTTAKITMLKYLQNLQPIIP